MTPHPDNYDPLLKEFFHAQMKRPWPAAPIPQSEVMPRQSARIARRPDSIVQSRLALAASVALMVGSFWYLAHDAQPRVSSGTPTSDHSRIRLPDATAGGNKGDILDEMKEIKATQPPIQDPFGK